MENAFGEHCLYIYIQAKGAKGNCEKRAGRGFCCNKCEVDGDGNARVMKTSAWKFSFDLFLGSSVLRTAVLTCSKGGGEGGGRVRRIENVVSRLGECY